MGEHFERQAAFVARAVAGRVTLVYALVGALWIVLGGSIARRLASSEASLARVELVKGLVYVAVTATIVFAVAVRVTRGRVAERLRAFEQELRSEALGALTGSVWLERSLEAGAPAGQSGWRELTGQSDDDMRGAGWLDAIHPDDREALEREIPLLESQRAAAAAHVRVRAADGEYRHMLTRTVRPDRASPRLLTVFVDYTDRVRSQAERDELQRQVTAAQRFEEIGRMSAALAHDFNNQLTTISNTTELMAEAVTEPPLLEDLTAVKRAVRDAARLSRQMLIYVRRQPGEQTVFAVDEALRELAQVLERGLGPGVALAFEALAADSYVRADRGSFEQAIVNLVSNARDAVAGDGSVVVATASDDREVRIEVRDSGPGVPEELRQRVFEPFFSTKPEGRGTGLGLSITRQMAVEAGGDIEIDDAPEGGARFVLRLPRVTPEEAPAPSAESSVPAAAARRRCVLLVDDDAQVRRSTARLLTAAGYEVDVASDHAEALRCLRERSPDVLVSDVNLPGSSGPEVADAVREHVGAELPVVFITGRELSDAPRPRAVVVAKPFVLGELVRAVEVLCTSE